MTRRSDEFGDRLYIVTRAGGTFCALNVNHPNIRSQFLTNFIEREGFTIGGADDFHDGAEALSQISPALAEFTGSEHQDSVARRSQVRDRSFHHSRSGG